METTELFDKAADGNGKTKMFHVGVYIDPPTHALLPSVATFGPTLPQSSRRVVRDASTLCAGRLLHAPVLL